jgi:nucleotide-binding universal stress UspA family protein
MKKIFLPVDGSDHSRRAIRQAVDIARLSGGEVRVFHFQEREPSKAGVATFETTEEAAKI